MRTLTRLLRTLLLSIGVLALATSGATLAGAQETNDGDGDQTVTAQALDDHECDDTEWHFVITQVRDEASAPGSISVAFSDGADTLTLEKFTGGVAHYSTTGHLDATVESATAEIYEGWAGQFNLSHGPCEDEEPEEGDVAPALDFTSVTVDCPEPESDDEVLIVFRVEGDVADGQATVRLLDGGTETDSVLVNFNDGVAGGQFDHPAEAGALTVVVDHDGGSDTADVPAEDCETTQVDNDQQTSNNDQSPEPEPVVEDDEPVEVGGDEVVADERAETTTAIQGDEQVAAEDVENRAVENRAVQPETPAVLGSQAERGALPRTGADSTLALALVGAMMLATGFGLQRIGSRARARS